MRRLLVTVDAGELECGACALLDVDDVGTSMCLAFRADPWCRDVSTYVRLAACAEAEQAAEQKEAGR